MSPNEWAALAVAILTLTAGLAGAVRWMVKHYLYELRPNGGSSVKDTVDRLEKRIDSLFELIAGKSNE